MVAVLVAASNREYSCRLGNKNYTTTVAKIICIKFVKLYLNNKFVRFDVIKQVKQLPYYTSSI